MAETSGKSCWRGMVWIVLLVLVVILLILLAISALFNLGVWEEFWKLVGVEHALLLLGGRPPATPLSG